MNDTRNDDEPSADSKYIRLPWPTVAAVLAVVLVGALALGLFANRNLRSPVAVEPTSAPIAASTAAARTVQSAAAIPPTATVVPRPPTVEPTAVQAPLVTATPMSAQVSTTATPAPLAPSPAATPRPTVSPEIAAEVAVAYEHYWQVRAEALFDLDTSHLDEVMADDHLAAAQELVGQLKSEGRAIRTDVSHNYAIVQGNATEALIIDDYVDRSTYLDAGSRETLTKPTNGSLLEQYRLRKIDGVWRVISLVRAP